MVENRDVWGGVKFRPERKRRKEEKGGKQGKRNKINSPTFPQGHRQVTPALLFLYSTVLCCFFW